MKEFHDRHVGLQSRRTRDNLIFYGVQETNGKNCEEKLTIFIQETLDIHKDIEFHKVHRMDERTLRQRDFSL